DPGQSEVTFDELAYARLVWSPAAGGFRRHPDLLGEHRDCRWVEDVNLFLADRAHGWVWLAQRWPLDRHERLRLAHQSGRTPVPSEPPPKFRYLVTQPDDGRATAALGRGPGGEGVQRIRVGVHGHQVGSGVAERPELSI